jgi:hypothetical protein
VRHVHDTEKTTKSNDSNVTSNPPEDDATLLFVCGECHVTFQSSEELEKHANEEHQLNVNDKKDDQPAVVEVRIVVSYEIKVN